MVDHYAVLGVASTASPKEIQAAFHAIAMATHPDRNPGDAEKERRFKEASASYEVLSDANQRKTYDDKRRQTARSQRSADTSPAYSTSGRWVHVQPYRQPEAQPFPTTTASPARSPQAIPSGLGVLGVVAFLGLAGLAAHAVDQRRTYWDRSTKRRRGRDGQFRSTDSWW